MAVAADVDHVVVGAGLSGLLLTQALLSDGRGATRPRIVLVDPSPAERRPTTYAYWARRPTSLDRWRIGSWDLLRVVDRDGHTSTVSLGDWRCTAVDWGRGRAELLDEVAADPGSHSCANRSTMSATVPTPLQHWSQAHG